MRTLLAVAFLVHGIAHVVGFVVPWRLVTSPEIPYRTTVLGLDVGGIGVRLIGLAWLIVAVSFISLALAVWGQSAWSDQMAYGLVAMSLVLCVLGLPESRPGIPANLVVAGLLAIGYALKV